MITQHLIETPVVNRWILGLSILGFHGLFQRTFGLCKSSALGKNWDQLVAAVIPMESYGYNVKPVVRWFSMNSKVFVSKFHADNFSGWEKVKVRDFLHDVSVRSQQLFSLGHESGAVHLVVVALPPCCQPGQIQPHQPRILDQRCFVSSTKDKAVVSCDWGEVIYI